MLRRFSTHAARKALHAYDTNLLNLPRLPLPSVEQTVTRYLETLQPLLSPADLARNKQHAAAFIGSPEAKKIQAHLEKVAKADGYPYHYFEAAWDDMYYGGRWPLMVHVNPFFAFKDETNPAKQEQLSRTAAFSLGLVKWFRKVVEGRLEPDMEKGKPLDGYQYPLVFGVERVPHDERDLFIPHGERSKHVIVIHRHKYYRVDVVTHDGKIISQEALTRELAKIRGNKGTSPDQDVGLLTTGDRAHYSKSRHEMIRVSPTVNGPSFKEIDSSLFVIVLEDASSDSLVERSRQFLHGTDGSNRWFDKHMVIAHADGALGMCLEHGCNDGMTWNRMLVEAWADVKGEKSPFSPITLPEVDKPISETLELEWDLRGGKTQANLAKAQEEADKLVNDVDTYVLDFKEFGREKVKKWGVSPDAAAQMSFQLAYARVNPTLGSPATYESCAMKPYFHGRTETIRSCTSEAKAMVEAFNSPNTTPEQRREALIMASNKHVAVAAGARSCSGPNIGCDRHLLGMKTTAAELGIPLPALFADPAYARSNTWVLSTSNVTTPFFDLFGFGAVSGKGYGLGYMTLPDSMPVNITSFRSGQSPQTSSAHLGKAIAQALRDFDIAFSAGKK